MSSGLHACWSFPIYATTGNLIGVVACYFDQPVLPSLADIQALQLFAHTAGLAMERYASKYRNVELASLVDPQSTLDRLAFLAVPHFADWCAIDLLQEDGTLKRVAVAHSKPEKVQMAYDLVRRFPPDPAQRQGA